MLVVSRKNNEGILLINRQTGERISFTLIRATSDRCRVGIEATQDWNILRTPEHLDEAGNPTSHPNEDKETPNVEAEQA